MQAVLNRAKDIKTIARDDARVKGVMTVMAKHRRRHDSLIEVLHVVQDSFGYIPLDIMAFISKEMRITPSRIYGVVTFYHFFSLKPKGEHNCVVCTGTACHVKGAQELVAKITETFSIQPGETTPDGRLGLQIARCIGCCGLAPVVVMDEEILAKVKPDEVAGQIRSKIGDSHG